MVSNSRSVPDLSIPCLNAHYAGPSIKNIRLSSIPTKITPISNLNSKSNSSSSNLVSDPLISKFRAKSRASSRLVRSKLYWEKRQLMKRYTISSVLSAEVNDKRPYANVLINNVPFKGLLDSGASVSVLGRGSEKFITDAASQFHNFPSMISTASGQAQRVFGYIHAEVLFNGATHNLTLYLVPSLEQALYLGIDFWNRFGIIPKISSLSLPEDVPDINLPPKTHLLSSMDQQKLSQIKNSFPSSAKLGLGQTPLLTHSIDVGSAKPVKQRFYSVSPAVQTLMYKELDRMLSLGVIEVSQSSWCSPVTLVRKANGKVRLCLDARELNKATVKDAYPLPLINGLLGRLDQTRFISAIDLKDAFWQIPLDPQSRDKTAFTVPGRPLYQFTVMPFGLCNAPQTLCRLMHKVIPHQLHDKVFVYLDDLLVTSATLQEHFVLLKEVSRLLKTAGLTINLDKSKFVLKEVDYLGYIVGEGCLRTNPVKCKAILEYPIPKTTKQIRRFLGMCGWYRRFIPNFASLAAPLTDLTGKSHKIVWSASADSAFNSLKLSLSSAPVLANPDYSKPFYIQCDASTVGVGSVLFQVDAEGNERPIEFISHKLNAAQRNYSVTELECYAAVHSVQKFRPYVEGYPFVIYTDHASLKWLMSQKDLSGRLARWSLKLQAFDFQIGYRKGSVNIVPDALSRAFCDETPPCVDDPKCKSNADPGVQSVSQRSEPTLLNESVDALSSSYPTVPILHLDLSSSAFQDSEYVDQITKIKQLGSNASNFQVQGNKLLIASFQGINYLDNDLPSWRLVVPNSLTKNLIEQAHVPPTSAHLGGSKTLERLHRQFYWPRMAMQVKSYIAACAKCKMNKAVNFSTQPVMGAAVVSTRPFQKLFVDFLGPYPRSKRGNSYIVIVLDHFSKFVLVKPLREASASLLCNFLENDVFLLFSVPEVITSDNGKQFTSNLFKDLLMRYGISHVRTPVYSPQSNASERVNRTLLSSLRAYVSDNEHNEWDKHLQEIAAALRNAIHDTLRHSPHYVVFGQHMSLHGSDYPLRRLLDEHDSSEIQVLSKPDRLNVLKERIQHYLKVAHENSAKRYNLRSNRRFFRIGQPVFVRSFALSDAFNKFSAKLGAKFKPAIISDKVGSVAYQLKDPEGKLLGIFHTKDIRV